MEQNDTFPDAIFTYTDQEAVDDGVLVPLNKTDRVTRAVWDYFEARTGSRTPPLRWPLGNSPRAMYPYSDPQDMFWRTSALTSGLIEKYADSARDVYAQNIGGGVWFASLEATETEITALRPGMKTEGAVTLWLLPNELGGVTLMFPEDY